MARLQRILCVRLSSEALDLRLAQAFCFAMAPALLLLAAIALQKHATTPGEVVVGLLAAVSACLLCVVLGLLLPMTRKNSTN